MRNGDLFHALEALADCQDVRDLDALLRPARLAGRELAAVKVAERRSFGPRVDELMAKVSANRVLRDPRAAAALAVLADVAVRLK